MSRSESFHETKMLKLKSENSCRQILITKLFCERCCRCDNVVGRFSLDKKHLALDKAAICITLSAAQIKSRNYKQPLYPQTSSYNDFPKRFALRSQLVILSCACLRLVVVVRSIYTERRYSSYTI